MCSLHAQKGNAAEHALSMLWRVAGAPPQCVAVACWWLTGWTSKGWAQAVAPSPEFSTQQHIARESCSWVYWVLPTHITSLSFTPQLDNCTQEGTGGGATP